ncbi:MAG: phosphotransferase [Microthrixaceae bacterium]
MYLLEPHWCVRRRRLGPLVIEWVDGAMPMAPLGHGDVDLLGLVEAPPSKAEKPCSHARMHIPDCSGIGNSVDEPIDGLDAWSRRYLERLAELEVAVADAIRGDCLIHLDLRSDNVIFSSARPEHDVVVDWQASVGAPWIDLVGLLLALELDGGPTPEEVLRTTRGQGCRPRLRHSLRRIDRWLLHQDVALGPTTGLPTVRPFQAAQGRIARTVGCASRRGWRADDMSGDRSLREPANTKCAAWADTGQAGPPVVAISSAPKPHFRHGQGS